MNNQIPVIIPSYEPDERLLELLKNLVGNDINNIILVDDGSGVDFEKFFDEAKNKYGAKVLRHQKNLGKGAALKTAFSYCLENLPDLFGCVTADSDGQHSPDCILKCMQGLTEDVDLVLGCRDFTLPNIPKKSVMGNMYTNKIIKNLYGKNISDTQTGLRCLSKKFMEKCVEIKGQRFEYEIRMLSSAIEDDFEIREVPIETIYDSKINHSTHFRPIIDTIKIYKALGLFKSLWILFFRK